MSSKLKNKIKQFNNKKDILNSKNTQIVESFDVRLANVINSNKKISERIIGYIPYDLQFTIQCR